MYSTISRGVRSARRSVHEADRCLGGFSYYAGGLYHAFPTLILYSQAMPISVVFKKVADLLERVSGGLPGREYFGHQCLR